MNQSEMLLNWGLQKTTCNYYYLTEPVEVEFEFNGLIGSRPGYAYVKFRVEFSEQLTFSVNVQWPKEFNAEYAWRIQNTIAEALIDGLLACEGYPYRGCNVQLIGFQWDSVGGSERAVQRATAEAVNLLCSSSAWKFSTGHYRAYEECDDVS